MPSRSRPHDASPLTPGSYGISSWRSICAPSAGAHSRRTWRYRRIDPKRPCRPGIPITYVPARNTVFLSLALGWAETLSAFDIFVGVNCVDYSGYPDCRPEFLNSFESLANLATRAGVEGEGNFRIHAPLLTLTKEQIIARGRALGVDYSLTHSCYDPSPDGLSCGRCDACRIRLAAFEKLGLADPIRYADPAGA